MKTTALKIGAILVLIFLIAWGDSLFKFSEPISGKIYDFLSLLHKRASDPPPEANEIVLVAIDSKTISNMKERWPYSRATFATVINHLKQANPKAIGLDFSFFGDSIPEEDLELIQAMTEGGKVVLGTTLSEQGGLQYSNLSHLNAAPISGIVNKHQDEDGVTRRALTYLVHKNSKLQRFFSWEMKLLETSGEIKLASLNDEGDQLNLEGPEESWSIPVDPMTKTFLINFQVRSRDFTRYSFVDIFEDRFDPGQIKNKIVLIGLLSELLQDIHRTPIGWIPGLTLNANALLTLYAKDFIRPLPDIWNWVFVFLGVLPISLVFSTKGLRKVSPLVFLEVAFFLILSYLFLREGYTWNYGFFSLTLFAVLSLMWLRYRLVHLLLEMRGKKC